MSFSDAQLIHAVEQGLRRTSRLDGLRVVGIRCEAVYFYGLSTNTFARCEASIIADGKA